MFEQFIHGIQKAPKRSLMWGVALGLELFQSWKRIPIFIWEFRIALRVSQSFTRWVLH
jgi:hypothetical protein